MFTDRRYTSRDIVAIRNDVIDFIKQRTNKITDFSESELTMVYVEVLAGVSDMLNYYLDNQALETHLMTARQPKNIKAALQTINYKIDTIGSAKGYIEAKIATGDGVTYSGSIYIPKYTRVCNIDAPIVQYVTTEDCILSQTNAVAMVPIMQGTRRTLEVKARDLKKAYKYYLPEGKIPLDGVMVMQGGEYWEQVPDAFLEIHGGMKYSVHSDEDDRVYLMFTFDWRSYLPQDDAEKITVHYLESAGTAGVVSELSLTKIMDTIQDQEGFPCNSFVEIINYDKTYGAFDSVDLTLAKAKARNLVKTMGRYITLSDYDAGIAAEPYILHTKTFDWQSDPDLLDRPNIVQSYVVTVDGTNVQEVQLLELQEKVYAKGVATTEVEIYSAKFVHIPISVNVSLRGRGDFRIAMKSRIEAALAEEFSLKNLRFGDRINAQRIKDVVSNVSSEITAVEVVLEQEEYNLGKIEFPDISYIHVELVGDVYGQKVDL